MNETATKPKLLYVVDPPLSIPGGVGLLSKILIEHFSKEYQVFLLSRDDPAEFSNQEISQHLAGCIKWAPLSSPPNWDFLQYTANIASQVADLGINLAHFQTSAFNYGSRFWGFSLPRQLAKKGIPCLWTNHALINPLDAYGGYSNTFLERILWSPLAWLGKANQLQNTLFEIQVSHFNLKRMRRLWPFFSNKYVQIYHSKIDSVGIKKSLRHKNILNLGYISFLKRQDLLVKAFLKIAAKHPDWELHLAGHDTDDGCKQMIEKELEKSPAKSRVHFLGHVIDTDSTMRECGIYVHTSDKESLGLALQEAMHHECPCIASDIAAHKELLAIPQSGLLFKHGNVNDLAIKLDEALNNADLRARLGSTAKKSIMSMGMTRTNMVDRHSHIYRDILRK
jgi:glycosyltransferase involved in cell wall biosynthesis